MFNKEKIVEEYIREQIRNYDAKTAKENIHEIYLRVIKSFERYINVVVIKVSGKIIQTKMRINNFEDFKKTVGGKCRPLPIGNYGLCLVNDDGFGLELNKLATLIYEKAAKALGFNASGFLVGDVVCLGCANEDGEYLDIPEKFVKFIEEVSNVKLKSTKVEPTKVESVVFMDEEKIF